VAPRIAALISHFDDLNRAHEAVLKAKRQIELLTPLVADCDRHAALADATEALRASREALRPYFAKLKLALLEKRIIGLDEEGVRQDARILELTERRNRQRSDAAELKLSIAANGGDRLERLAEEIRVKSVERDGRKKKSERYAELVHVAGGRPGDDEVAFQRQYQETVRQLEQTDAREAELQNALTEQSVELHQGREQHTQLTSEIDSLKARRSNIPAEQIRMRAAMCEALELQAEEIPFAGELLQVREEAQEWEGAAERLLHNFGLSLLVPDGHYKRVSDWVDRTHLRGRLVYFRVRASSRGRQQALHPDSLARKLAIKPDSPFYDWLERELTHRRCIRTPWRANSR